MGKLPSYLRESYYAQKYEASLLAEQPIAEPLPSKLLDDKAVPPMISISSDNMEVKFIGPVRNSDTDAASVRADHPMPPSTGLYYFEATILSKGRDGFIGIGFCRHGSAANRLPGWEEDSWGYHGDDGHSFSCQTTGQDYGPKFTTGDVVGCAVNFGSGECFYTKNGVHLGTAFTGLSGDLYPSIGLKTIGEQVRVNFGAQPFVFDIEYYYRQEKMRLYKSVRDEEDDISGRVQSLVSSYLSHNGYVDSARAMAVDISSHTNKLVSYPPIDTEASNRQRIRAYVLEGDMDSALEMLEGLFPEALQQHEMLYFRIRCRKFIEMMRASTESQQSSFIDDKELGPELDIMDADDEKDVTMKDVTKVSTLRSNGRTKRPDSAASLAAAIEYGRQLQTLYANAGSNYKNGLQNAFSLLAYPDPQNSPIAHLLEPSLRAEIAEEINRAILVSSGKSARSELEEIVASVGMKIGGVKGAEFINVHRDFLRDV